MVLRLIRPVALMGLLLVGVVTGGSARSSAAASANLTVLSAPPWEATGLAAYKCSDFLCVGRPNGSRHRYLVSNGRIWPEWDPSLAPKGRFVAFRGYYAPGDGAYALYVAGTNGCGRRRLTRLIGGDPSWSPDGHWIAFDRSGFGEIWKVRPDGSALTRIARGAGAASPAWSPDGRTIVFGRVSRGHGQIWSMHPNGTGAKLLRTDALFGDTEPAAAWSHDGKRLAFVARVGQRVEIKVMTADGRSVRAMTSRFASTWNPLWLPHDSGIAFLGGAGPGFGSAHLFVARSDGSGIRRIRGLQTEQFDWVGAPLPARRC
ncbi:MAG: TolB family protein [Gaiellaceae bacterium]